MVKTATKKRGARSARESLAVERADAWFEYLAFTERLSGSRYEELEPWAWTRLQVKLRAVVARERALEDDGA